LWSKITAASNTEFDRCSDFKRFETAVITISGIELAEKIRKQQVKTGKLPGRPKVAPEIWAALLAA
jgi:hypothetical protein